MSDGKRPRPPWPGRPVLGPVALIVLDGWGLAEPGPSNAVSLGATPHFDRLWERWPHATLAASGEAVGLAAGQMGNSNVGHLNLGAGRTVRQDLTRIDHAVGSGDLPTNPAFVRICEAAQGKRLHIWGLLSDGGVHSHVRHLWPLLEAVAARGVETVVHAVLDGRDTAPDRGLDSVRELGSLCDRLGMRIATVSGRYFAMDRDKRWDRVQLAYEAMVRGEGRLARSAEAAVLAAYAEGETDEFVRPTVIVGESGTPDRGGSSRDTASDRSAASRSDGRRAASRGLPVRPGDVVLCFNFRADRARELTAAFIDPDFDGFPRVYPLVSAYGGFTGYEASLAARMEVLFPPPTLAATVGEVVSRAGLRQLRIAETEKYAHVTYFFNGGVEAPFDGEDRRLVPSPKVATYDLQPEMSAAEVAAQAVVALRETPYDLVVLNFANPDMVGHTGVLEAAVHAVEAADVGLGVVTAEIERQDGAALVLADHGNAEVMLDPESGGPWTAHTTNLVPCILVAPPLVPPRGPAIPRLRSGGTLGDVAPTLLQLLGLAPPPEMTGRSLLRG